MSHLAVVAALEGVFPADVVGGVVGWRWGICVAAEESSVPGSRSTIGVHGHPVLVVL